MTQKVIKAQDTLSKLTQERTALLDGIEVLDEDYRLAVVTLDSAYAKAERTGDTEALRSAQTAEREGQVVQASLRRKQAALVACEKDLSVARQEHESAVWAAAMEQELSIVSELDGLAEELQGNCLQPELWQRVCELTQAGNRLYISQLRTEGMRSIFVDGGNARCHFFSGVQSAMNDGHKEFQSISDILQLEQVRRRLGSVRQS